MGVDRSNTRRITPGTRSGNPIARRLAMMPRNDPACLRKIPKIAGMWGPRAGPATRAIGARRGQAAFTSIDFSLALAAADLGSVTVSTPLAKLASIPAVSTLCGIEKLRWNAP